MSSFSLSFFICNIIVDDVTSNLLLQWSTAGIPVPDLVELNHFLKRPFLPEEKVTVSSDFFRKAVPTLDPLDRVNWCSVSVLEDLFHVDESRSASELLHLLTIAVKGRPPPNDGTEASFISFWDKNIGDILLGLVPNCRQIRESNKYTNTCLQRPDFGLLFRLICLFRDEEEAEDYSGQHPRDELLSKLNWNYDPAPYVLGLHFTTTSNYSTNNSLSLQRIMPLAIM